MGECDGPDTLLCRSVWTQFEPYLSATPSALSFPGQLLAGVGTTSSPLSQPEHLDRRQRRPSWELSAGEMLHLMTRTCLGFRDGLCPKSPKGS